jgi:hypothetical protein
VEQTKKDFIIGRSQKPQCFENVKKLPVEYVGNKKAWMTSDIFKQYVSKWNEVKNKNEKKITSCR